MERPRLVSYAMLGLLLTVSVCFPVGAQAKTPQGKKQPVVKQKTTLQKPDELSFKVREFPDAVVGRRYSFSIEPVSGVPPYKISLVSGALPPGLTLNNRTGGVEGEPTQGGKWKLTLRVVDAKGKKGTFSGVIQVWRILTVGEHGTFKGFDGLQMALNMALDMDQIRIEKGTYAGSGVVIPQNKAWDNGIRISGGWNEAFSERDDNPEATILDGNKAETRILTLANAKGEVALENLGFRNSNGGAVRADRAAKESFVVFTNCTFAANSTVGYGNYGGAVSGGGTFANCTFIDNGSEAVHCVVQSSFTNCTFTRNSYGAVSGGGTFSNCTFTQNSVGTGQMMGSCGGAVNGGGTFTNCMFTDNLASAGGAVHGGGTFTNCTFTGNSASAAGGAVDGDGTFAKCTFINNSVRNVSAPSGNGGAVSGSGAFTNCTFTGNSALDGGAVEGAGAFTNCTFTDNSASSGGAVDSGTMELSIFKTCVFKGNSARIGGAFIGMGIFISCVFADNSAEEIGGAFTDEYPSPIGRAASGGSFINCVFCGNKAGTEGGGIKGQVKLLNCIFYKNTAAGKDNDVAATGSTEIDYSLLTYITGAANCGTHNIMTAEPRFTDPDNGDFTLQPDSPCINAGKMIPEPVPVGPCAPYVHNCHRGGIIPKSVPVGSLDLAGKPRVVGGKIDMGAYEWQGK